MIHLILSQQWNSASQESSAPILFSLPSLPSFSCSGNKASRIASL